MNSGSPVPISPHATGLPDPAQKVTVRELAGSPATSSGPTEFLPHLWRAQFTWNKIRQQNRNPLLTMNIGADGLKTGFTQDGGYGLVGSAVQNDLRLIVVVNGLKTAKDRAEEAKKLVEFGFRGLDQRSLFDRRAGGGLCEAVWRRLVLGRTGRGRRDRRADAEKFAGPAGRQNSLFRPGAGARQSLASRSVRCRSFAAIMLSPRPAVCRRARGAWHAVPAGFRRCFRTGDRALSVCPKKL